MPPKKPKKVLDKTKLKAWLKSKGHSEQNAEKIKSASDIHKALFELHGLNGKI